MMELKVSEDHLLQLKKTRGKSTNQPTIFMIPEHPKMQMWCLNIQIKQR